MSERKVLNKYFPPNFDPTKIPKNKIPKDKQCIVRLMSPFSMRCSTCGEYIYKGRKFNARKETVEGEHYLTIRIYRFYIRCPICAAEITFKTDPQNSDYVCELGATRNFEPWRAEQESLESSKRKRAELEENNPMAALENKTFDSKREIEILDALDEIRAINARHQKVDPDALLHEINQKPTEDEKFQAIVKNQQDMEDEELVRQFFPAQARLPEAVKTEASPMVSTLPASPLLHARLPIEQGNVVRNQPMPTATLPQAKPVIVKKNAAQLGIVKKPKSSPSV